MNTKSKTPKTRKPQARLRDLKSKGDTVKGGALNAYLVANKDAFTLSNINPYAGMPTKNHNETWICEEEA